MGLFFLIAMGKPGMEAFSKLSGLQILSGTYDLQDSGAMIQAEGKDKTGTTWQIKCLWRNGMPWWIWLYDPKVLI